MSTPILPPEIYLDVFPHLFPSPTTHLSLRLTSKVLNELLTRHERGVVSATHHLHFESRTLHLFPSLLPLTTYKGLHTLTARLATLDRLQVHRSRLTKSVPDLSWLGSGSSHSSGRWERLHKAGLLLLYRLQDIDPPISADEDQDASKRGLLHSLSASSLACLLFVLVSSVHLLRAGGPEPIAQGFAKGDVGIRSEVEVVVEEVLLSRGPRALEGLLEAGRLRLNGELGEKEKKKGDQDGKQKEVEEVRRKREGDGAWAVALLHAELAALPARQAPLPVTGALRPTTLIASLRRALAAQTGCALPEVVPCMWEILSRTAFDAGGGREQEEGGWMVRVVCGEAVEGGERRMGF